MTHDRVDGDGPRYFGLYPAIVTDIVDTDELGRIQVGFPWLGADGSEVRAWATLLSPYAEDDQGLMILPSVDTQVVVGFEAGDLRRPYIVGSAWNGQEALPEAAEEANNIRVIKTRSGCLLKFDDTEGSPVVTLSTPAGNELVLDEGSSEVLLKHSSGHSIKFTSGGAVEIKANSTVELTASAFNVHAASAVFDGTITCTTLTAQTSIVSPSYTPGAGNVW